MIYVRSSGGGGGRWERGEEQGTYTGLDGGGKGEREREGDGSGEEGEEVVTKEWWRWC